MGAIAIFLWERNMSSVGVEVATTTRHDQPLGR